MSDLGKAISITASAFRDVTDKGGNPYILHCLHVMNKMKYEDDEELMIVAVLHDLVEDTEWTFHALTNHGFSKRVTDLLRLLTHDKSIPYMDYIGKLAINPDARKIKIQDLRHNSDLFRIKGIRDKDTERLKKYHKAYLYLKEYNQ